MVKEKSLLYWKNNKTKREPLAPLNKKGGKTMKKFSVLIATVISITLFLSFKPSFASWIINCQGRQGSFMCIATMGGIEIQWNDIKGLTGVRGLPLGIEDFQRQEKVVSQAMEKTSIIKKSTTQRVSTPAEVPAGAGTDTGKENVFSRKQSMSQSKTMGEGIKIDYTLAFVKWVGDHHPFISDEMRKSKHFAKYAKACELIIDMYNKGKINALIERFILARDLDIIKNAKIVSKDKLEKLSDTEKSIIMAKFVSLAALWDIQNEVERFNMALILSATAETDENFLQEIADAYIFRLERIQKIKQPINVLQLADADKGTAFTKWIAESKPDILPYITNLDDRYIVFFSQSFYDKNSSIVPQLMQEFEKALENQNESVTKVVYSKFEPIKEKLADVADTIGNKKSFLFILIPVIAIIVFIKIKKKHKNHQ